jgi:hypothetical protein
MNTNTLLSQMQTHMLTPSDIGVEKKKLNVEIKKIQLKEGLSLEVGNIQWRSKIELIRVNIDKGHEDSVLNFIKRQFQQKSKGMDIVMLITECKIYPVEIGKCNTQDTFRFQCEFYKNEVDASNYLYMFKAKNLMGSFDKAENVMNNYYSRALLSAVNNFSTAIELHPEWFITDIKNEKPIKTSVIFNAIKGKDTIACENNFHVSKSDFTLNEKDTSSRQIFTKVTLTYKIDATESNKELNLKIYPKAFFEKSRSWIKPNTDFETYKDYQQGIIDLCTIYGAKLNEALKNKSYSLGEYKSEINTAYNEVFGEYVQMRKDFKNETNEGQNIQKMKEWQQRIFLLMKEIK